MNYQNIYNSIIAKAQSQVRSKKESYYESHHILPKSLGGSNNKDNLVLLTAKEHFVCHHLLAKIHSGKMWYAFNMMTIISTGQDRYMTNARVYALIKHKVSEQRRGHWTGDKNPMTWRNVKGDKNPMFGRHRSGSENPFFGKHHSDETKRKISEANSGKSVGSKNGRYLGVVITPLGNFESYRAAGLAHGCDNTTIKNRCKNPNFNNYVLIPK